MTRAWIMAAFVAMTALGCGGKGDCVLSCAGECQGSPTYACQEECEREECGIVHDTDDRE